MVLLDHLAAARLCYEGWWCVRLKAEGSNHNPAPSPPRQVHWLGFYNDQEAAAHAHDAEALRRYGPSADLNFNGDRCKDKPFVAY